MDTSAQKEPLAPDAPRLEARRAGRRALAAAVGVALVLVSTALAGCGGSSGAASPDDGNGASRHAITADECQSLQGVVDDLQLADAGFGLDYPTDQSTVDTIADTVDFPSSVSDAYGTFQEAIDELASVFQDIGIEPNDTPLPDQLDELQSRFHANDSQAEAGATISTWVQNDCD